VANDKLHQWRKARTQKELRRQKAKRASYDRVLIVCEGSKTEPIYLTDLKDCLRLNSANIEIDGDCGSSPISVYEHAYRRYLKEKRNSNPYDRVFCVFDKDRHDDAYDQAKAKIQSSRPKDVFKAIISVPCYEYFLLLHFEYTTKPFIATGTKSVCDCVIHDLRQHIPSYEKGDNGLFEATHDKLEDALINCKRAKSDAQRAGTDNPTTLMHELVEYLKELASS